MAETPEERLLARAAGPGRIRSAALELWAAARTGPVRLVWGRGLREARALHSAERRLVQDALYSLVRDEGRLRSLLGTVDPLAFWLGWLVRRGLPVERARGELPAPYERLLLEWETVGAALPVAERLALRHALPQSVVQRLLGPLGEEETARALEASDSRAPIDLRVNPQKGSRQALAERLAKEGIETEPLPRVPHGLRVRGRANLEGTAPFRQGWFELQDEGSQLVVEQIPLRPGMRVLDVCAGAGGKSLALAARGARVLALDPRRAALMELHKRAERAGVAIQTRTIPEDRLPGDLPLAEIVLVDAPCTGTGVLRRHPEHRWQLDETQIAARVALQGRLLRQASAQVLAKGALVYVTCSILEDENERVVQSFLAERPEFTLEASLRTWPHRDGCDGFYTAVLRRSSP